MTKANASIAAVWQLLSSFGDKYAAAGYQAIAQPTSLYCEVVRNSWAAAEADFSGKFIAVALSHLTNYMDFSLAKLSDAGLSPDWYSSPCVTFGTGLGLEASRTGPTAPEVQTHDLLSAAEHSALVTADTSDTLLTTGELEHSTLAIVLANQAADAIYKATGLSTLTVTTGPADGLASARFGSHGVGALHAHSSM